MSVSQPMVQPASIKPRSSCASGVAPPTRIRPSLAPMDWSARSMPISAFSAPQCHPAVVIPAAVASAIRTTPSHAPPTIRLPSAMEV